MLRDKGLTQDITITSKYKDLQGESYETQWTINPLLEGSGYFDFRDFEDQVQALEDQARALGRSPRSMKCKPPLRRTKVSVDHVLTG